MDAYAAVLAQGRADPADALTRLAETLGGSSVGNGGHVYFDGFTDFTGAEAQVIRELIKKDAYVTVCLGCDDLYGDSEQFEPSRRAANMLARMDTTMDALRRLLRSLDGSWDGAREALPIPFPRLKPLKNYAFDDRKAAFTAARDACRKAVDALCAVFEAPSEKLLGELLLTAPAMKALINLTLEFDRQYALLKRRNNLLDFSDLEHFAVALLCDGESGLPTAAAAEISERYTEIMSFGALFRVSSYIFIISQRFEKQSGSGFPSKVSSRSQWSVKQSVSAPSFRDASAMRLS